MEVQSITQTRKSPQHLQHTTFARFAVRLAIGRCAVFAEPILTRSISIVRTSLHVAYVIHHPVFPS